MSLNVGPEKVYVCPPRRAMFVVGAVLAFAAGLFLSAQAATGRWVLTIDGIRLSPAASQAVQFGLGFFGLAVGAMSVGWLVLRSIAPMRLVLGPDALAVPGHLWAIENTVVPYRDVTAVRLDRTSGMTVLRVTHRGGRLRVRRPDFASADDFDAFRAELDRRVAAAKRP
jgi:hypothetical protein